MRILLYEYLTGGGTWSEGNVPPGGSMLREGAAMISALIEDFLRLPHVELVTLRDSRLAALAWPDRVAVHCVDSAIRETDLLTMLSAIADGTLLIAPECGGALEQRARLVAAHGGRLLSPDGDFIQLTANKDETARYLARHEIPVPTGCVLPPGLPLPVNFSYPAVLKPLDGAGSWNVQYVTEANSKVSRPPGTAMRLETFCPGLAASIAVIRGPHDYTILPASEQRLSHDGQFQYLGGRTPLPAPLNQRAQHLVRRVAAALPATIGYFGIDVVLAIEEGQRDVVIEVNPRLTTSYVGLRRLTRGNLAEAMLHIANGITFALSFTTNPIEFSV